MDAQDIVWESPPEVREVVNYALFYATLRENSGEWAIYPGTQSAASQWCDRYDAFEYRSAMVDGQRKVWMRHVDPD